MPLGNNWPNTPPATPALSHLERRTGQLASLGAITLLTAPTPDLYAVDVYLECTAAGSAGTVLATVNYTDSNGAAAQVTGALVLTSAAALTAHLSLRVAFWVASGDITVTTTVTGAIGGPTYNFTARAERCWSSQ